MESNVLSVLELKQALKQLQAQHPEAYDEFVRTLHPGAGSMAVLKPSEVRSFSFDNEFTFILLQYLKVFVLYAQGDKCTLIETGQLCNEFVF